MPLKYQTLTIALGKGVRTDVDQKTLTPGELILLENGVFDGRSTIQKRRGAAALDRAVAKTTAAATDGSFETGLALGSTGDALVAMGKGKGLYTASGPDTPRVFSRAKNAQRWSEVGTCGPVEVSVTKISQPLEFVAAPDACVVDGKYAIYTMETRASALAANADTAGVFVVDLTTGARLWEASLVTANENTPKPVAIGTKALIFTADDGGPNIEVWTWDSATPAVGPVLVGNVATNLQTSELWDVCELDATNCVLSYETTGNIVYSVLVDSTGTTSNNRSIVENPVAALTVFKVSDGTTDYVCVAYQLTGGTNIRFNLLTTTLGTFTAAATAFDAGDTAYHLTGARETESNAERIRIFATVRIAASAARLLVRSGQVTFAGAATGGSTDFQHSTLAGKAFYANNRANVLCLHGSDVGDNLQPTYFLKSVDGALYSGSVPQTIAKLLYARGPYVTEYLRETAAATVAGTLPQASSLGGGRWLIAGLNRERLIRDSVGLVDTPLTTKNLCSFTFDMSPELVPPTLNTASGLLFGGGYVGLFDGRFQEHGFHTFPAYFTVANSGTAGALAGATAYSFRLVAEWSDRFGQLHRSSPSAAVSFTTGAGANLSVDLTVHTLPEVDNSGYITGFAKVATVRIYVYRTLAGATGVYYRTGSYAVNVLAATVAINDGVADGTIDDNAILYTEGVVLENIGPPAMVSLAQNRGRLAGIPADDRTLVWYTKSKAAGIAYEWSDLLTFRLETHGDNTAIAAWQDKWIVFKRTAIYVISGDGASNTGVGGYDTPYLLSGDIGCVDRASVLSTSVGVFFKSARGLYLFDGALQYIGAPVEKYNAYTVVAAALEEDAHRAIFYLSDHQPALVYDYEFGQWSTFMNHDAVAAAVWQGKPVFLDSDGKVHVQGSDYLDDGVPYGLKLGLGWITMAGALGWQRFRKAGVLCDWKSPHTLMLRVYYRRGEVPEDRGTVVTGTDGVEAVRFDLALKAESVKGGHLMATRLPYQKVTAIRLEVEDTDPTGEDYTISAIMLEVGVKPGLAHLAAAKVA